MLLGLPDCNRKKAGEPMDLVVLPRSEAENNRQYARRVLLENIMTLHLKPGTVIQESEVARLLSVSRTPVREAIFRLKDLHLVEVYPQKASIVSRIHLGLINEAYFLRTQVEPAVYAIACNNLDRAHLQQLQQNLQAQQVVAEAQRGSAYTDFYRLDNEFHEIIYRAANKRHVWEAIQSISSHFQRIRYLYTLYFQGDIQLFYEEHKAIYYSVISGAAENIRRQYPGHLAPYQQALPQMLEAHPDYFEIA